MYEAYKKRHFLSYRIANFVFVLRQTRDFLKAAQTHHAFHLTCLLLHPSWWQPSNWFAILKGIHLVLCFSPSKRCLLSCLHPHLSLEKRICCMSTNSLCELVLFKPPSFSSFSKQSPHRIVTHLFFMRLLCDKVHHDLWVHLPTIYRHLTTV